MPNYPGASLATAPVASNFSPIALVNPGDAHYVFGVLAAGATQLPVQPGNVAGESPAAPQASVAVMLPASEQGAPPMVSLEIRFSGAPGAFNIQIQEADTDADAFYVTPSNGAYTITAVSANNIARVDLSPTGGKFLRVLLSSRTNAVSLTAKFTRLA
jgi:hypothetical protein